MFIDPAPDARLALLTLSVVGDDRPIDDQPPLKEGIHLRWGFARDLENNIVNGFPWYGYYVFRRLTPTGGTADACVGPELIGLPTGTRIGPLVLDVGTFSGVDANLLTFTEQFPLADRREIDLSEGATSFPIAKHVVKFVMDAGLPCRRVDVTLGFTAQFPPPGGSGGSSGGSGSGSGSSGDSGTGGGLGTGTGSTGGSTGIRGGEGGLSTPVGSNAGCMCGCDHAALVPIAERVVQIAPGQYRATFGYRNSNGESLSMPIGAENRFFPEPAERGQPTLFVPGRRTDVFAVVWDGLPLTWRLAGHTVTVSASNTTTPLPPDPGGPEPPTPDPPNPPDPDPPDPQPPTPDPPGPGPGPGLGGPPDGIVITALRTGVVVATRIVTGNAGEVKTVPIEAAAIDEIRLSNGPVRLIDLCIFRTTNGRGGGWEPVPGLTKPICLPVYHNDYPCNPGEISESASRDLAMPRISYGTTERWNDEPFADLHAELVQIVEGGVGKVITDHIEEVTADADPADPGSDEPVITQSSLDLLLQASVDPAVAQMLGLYWVDDTAVAGQSYDYLLAADHANAAGGSVATATDLVNAADYSSLDGCWALNVVRAVSPRLAAPLNPTVYALPVGAIPPSVPGDAAGIAGLTWDIPLENGMLPSTAAVLYHLWRADLGRLPLPGPGAEVDEDEHDRVSDTPVAPGMMLLEDPGTRLENWPAAPLFALDGPLVDGWYAYRLNGIDIFGRFSPRSAPARWLTTDAATVQNDFAVHLEDRTPPPPPTEVQAWVLDPADPNVIKDSGYDGWPSQFRNSPGLRVRWVWTGKHMRQSPDLREFRIYFTAGTVAPGSLDAWNARIAVVPPTEQIVGEDKLVTVLRDGVPVEGTGATASGATVTLGGTNLIDSVPIDGFELELSAASGRKVFRILELDVEHRTVLLDAAPSLAGASPWRIVLRERTYELFLPNTGLPFTLPLVPDAATPLLYALVGVTAADDKADVADGYDTGPLAGRTGNESGMGGPATVYRVHRTPPGATPLPPITNERLFATRADFNSQSFFALHWLRLPNLLLHVFRAMDQTLFAIDARKTEAARAAELNQLPLVPGWDATRQQAAIAEIGNTLHDPSNLSDYPRLGDNALRLLASLPSNTEAFTRLTRAPLGRTVPGTSDPLEPDFLGLNDSPDHDDPNFYEPDSTTRGAFPDTLDGRAGNRYFYRTASIDGAQNLGPLGVSTPPVYLPTSVLPQPPVLISVRGGDRQITVSWVPAVDSSIDTYRIYRAGSAGAARDLGTMEFIDTVTDARPPGTRTGPVTFADETVTPYQDYFYRVTAVSADDVESSAGPAMGTRAFDGSPPPEPTWERSEWVKLDSTGAEHPFTDTGSGLKPALAIKLAFASTTVVRVLVLRAQDTATSALAPWLSLAPEGAGTVTVATYISGLDPTVAHTLRARAVNRGGIERLSEPLEVSTP